MNATVEIVEMYHELLLENYNLKKAVKELGTLYSDGEVCFCELKNGNPMLHEHSNACLKIRKLLKGVE